ncbi:MAG: cation:proton antiporter [Clostridiales bacterium]|uniref:Cation:proton antiporter n=1 Tax=Zhenhengia yiwuensis TaxID=2763666 RepID=A0A926ELD7_9FIRM|nr:cation:proton antiporter [Zhenhengia yiwuensis]MBC8580620.1 cation:proton antiporter [Zhenhengia yiwuensis]MBU3812113.1 cation:proton antiporter [Candidatus Niameybacter stercoravium]MDU6360508.1 cation:proton antiporter [Clostridiales bacterium]
MLKGILLLICFIGIAFIAGKLVARVKLPAILGWLVAGMIIGPHALGWFNDEIMNNNWFHILINIGEVSVGLLIGTELIWKDLKQSGKQIITICVTEALGTFLVVTCAFGLIFSFMGIPLYLAVVFGAIALATAPAPSISIVNEYKTKGPVTKALIPLAALDDIIALVVFFLVIGVVSSMISDVRIPLYFVPLMIVIPVLIGGVTGFIAGHILKREMSKRMTLLSTMVCMCVTAAVGIFVNNYIMPKPVLNLMIVGVAFAATFANMMPKERVEDIMKTNMPVIGLFMIIVVLNLGAPLDYHLILGAGVFTVIYIVARALGKIGGAYTGAVLSKAPKTVKRYLGLTLLPHSGVSLIFTGSAVNVLIGPDPESATIIQGTIAAAAVINEIIAVFLAKQAFKAAGEIDGVGDVVLEDKEAAGIYN